MHLSSMPNSLDTWEKMLQDSDDDSLDRKK